MVWSFLCQKAVPTYSSRFTPLGAETFLHLMLESVAHAPLFRIMMSRNCAQWSGSPAYCVTACSYNLTWCTTLSGVLAETCPSFPQSGSRSFNSPACLFILILFPRVPWPFLLRLFFSTQISVVEGICRVATFGASLSCDHIQGQSGPGLKRIALKCRSIGGSLNRCVLQRQRMLTCCSAGEKGGPTLQSTSPSAWRERSAGMPSAPVLRGP